jgi:KaiC/GvpD/RAD55 family RecA-like ATPase
MAEIKRIKTGISGLDKLIEGGLLENSVTLISGGTGAGKTILSMQFLMELAKNKEKVLYISTEENESNIKEGFKIFGWDLDKLKIDVMNLGPDELEEEWEPLLSNKIDKEKIKRVVIDSISLTGIYYRDEYSTRKYIYKLISSLKKRNITCLLTSEIPENEKVLSKTGVEEFVCDGVILLQFLGLGGKYERGLTIRKMRWTNHTQEIHPYKIVKGKGIVLGK